MEISHTNQQNRASVKPIDFISSNRTSESNAFNGHDLHNPPQPNQRTTGNPEKADSNLKKEFDFHHHCGIRGKDSDLMQEMVE